MTLKIGVVMDPISHIKIQKDSTFAMLLEAQKRQWSLHYMQQQDLFLHNGMAYAHMRPLAVEDNPKSWFTLGTEQAQKLHELDVILMRKDPPFNQEYIYTTYILEHAERAGALIVNKPQSLRDANEKLFTTWFSQYCPETLVSRNCQQLREFFFTHEEVIYKPLEAMGGHNVFLVRKGDPNLSVILESLTQNGHNFIMAQRYIPEIVKGDKRVLLINGEPVPYALSRVPAKGELRGNLVAGAQGVGVEITARDRAICAEIGPVLRAKGLIFVGIDIIGDYLTEINVTSPTCIREIDACFSMNISAQLLDCIEELRRG
ncbi:glutathione synthase [soil metagenome]